MRHFRSVLYLLLLSSLLSCIRAAAIPSFPGAEGYGSNASGGRGGEVYIVTNLNDSGPGSLRFGLENSANPRTVVFEVGGTIPLATNLRVRNKRNLTLAGQTAPGDGILLRGATLQFEDCENLIVRHLRVRYGWDTGNESDAIWLRNTRNAIFDHLSASWGMDECFSLTKDTTHVTVQRSLIAEGAKEGHQYGMLVDSETLGGGRISLVGNLFINHIGRMPRSGSGIGEEVVLDMVNNVIYNWSSLGDWGVQGTALDPISRSNWNFVNNYSIAGRNTVTGIYRQTILRGGDGVDRFHIRGNRLDSNVDGILNGFEAGWENVEGDYIQMETPFSIPSWASIQSLCSADQALQTIIEDAGARPWGRDAVDARLISELSSFGTQGLVLTRLRPPEWPVLAGGEAPLDTDRDGMPDHWEDSHGLDPEDPTDGPQVASEEGYTHLELYLNGLVLPMVSLLDPQVSILEGEVAEVRIRRSGYATENLVVACEVTGDASRESDFTIPGTLAVLSVGNYETTIPVHALLDEEPYEQTESVRIRLLPSPENFILGDLEVTQVSIENLTPPVSLLRVR